MGEFSFPRAPLLRPSPLALEYLLGATDEFLESLGAYQRTLARRPAGAIGRGARQAVFLRLLDAVHYISNSPPWCPRLGDDGEILFETEINGWDGLSYMESVLSGLRAFVSEAVASIFPWWKQWGLSTALNPPYCFRFYLAGDAVGQGQFLTWWQPPSDVEVQILLDAWIRREFRGNEWQRRQVPDSLLRSLDAICLAMAKEKRGPEGGSFPWETSSFVTNDLIEQINVLRQSGQPPHPPSDWQDECGDTLFHRDIDLSPGDAWPDLPDSIAAKVAMQINRHDIGSDQGWDEYRDLEARAGHHDFDYAFLDNAINSGEDGEWDDYDLDGDLIESGIQQPVAVPLISDEVAAGVHTGQAILMQPDGYSGSSPSQSPHQRSAEPIWSGPKEPKRWAKDFGCTWRTLKNRMAAGTLRGKKIPKSKAWYIAKDDLPS